MQSILHGLTNIVPVLPCATSFSVLCTMVKRFMHIRPELEELAAINGLHLDISTAPRFDTRCKKL